jgi:nitrite reductase/ring-hydroxylating ferredoxin subunit
MKILTKILLFCILMLTSIKCNTPQNKIPFVYVDFTIDLNSAEFYELNAIGNYVYVTGGVSGIIIYRDSRDNFYAYERACPYDPDKGRVVVEKNGYRVIDSVCGSEFSLTMDGAVLKGPARLPLRKYNTYYYPASNQLRVVNQ